MSAKGFLKTAASSLGLFESASDPKIPGPFCGGVGVPKRSGLGSWGVALAAPSPNTFWLPPNTAAGALKGSEVPGFIESADDAVAVVPNSPGFGGDGFPALAPNSPGFGGEGFPNRSGFG